MRRKILGELQKWLYANNRKPLILRGARQIGKTWIARELAAKEELYLLEINFERNPELGELFLQKKPKTIIEQFPFISSHISVVS